jgi:hypothetical protein
VVINRGSLDTREGEFGYKKEVIVFRPELKNYY